MPSSLDSAASSSKSLSTLIRRARDADAAAAHLLLSRYRPYLRVLCALKLPRLCQRREDESDLVQQTLINALQALSGFRGETEAEFEVWVTRLLERNILQSVRRNTANKRDIRRESIKWKASDSAQLVWHTLAGDDSLPESSVFRGEAALQLAEALEQLPEDQRLAVELRYLGQQPLKFIADYMSKSTGAVAGLIRRGIDGLRESLPASFEEGRL